MEEHLHIVIHGIQHQLKQQAKDQFAYQTPTNRITAFFQQATMVINNPEPDNSEKEGFHNYHPLSTNFRYLDTQTSKFYEDSMIRTATTILEDILHNVQGLIDDDVLYQADWEI